MELLNLNIGLAAPEIVLLCGLFSVLLVDLWLNDEQRYISHFLSIGVMVAAAVAQFLTWGHDSAAAFHGMYLADGISKLGKTVVYLGTALLFVYAKPYNQARGIFKGEYYTLAMFAAVGASVMISAGHFLVAYIGLELLSLSLYALIALRRDSARAAEAALKYFVLGALASGLLLYGISMVYGATGKLEFAAVSEALLTQSANLWLLKLGLLMIVAGIAFKFGAVPFHMWLPDVYQGAPTSAAGLIGTLPKIAATVFAFRILVYGLAAVKADWQPMFAGLAVLSLLLGNLVAIMQTNIKRMLAYSTISHMGFILLSFVAGQMGLSAAVYYAITYVLTGLAGFGVLMLLSREDAECENIADLAGLNQRNAWYAFIMLLVMFSMAGIPPLMGFYAKFAVIKALLAAQYVWALPVAVFAVMMNLIGAFYYLRVVRAMYFEEKASDAPITGDASGRVLLSVNGLMLLVWGVFPAHLMALVAQAIDTAL